MNYQAGHAAFSCIALAALGASHSLAASFTITPTDNATMLAQAILGNGITIVGTPALSSQIGQSGVFANFNSGPYIQTGGRSGQYTLSSGAILTTGLATAATDVFIGGANVDAFGSGDAQLSTLSGTTTFDADVLTIQFTSANPILFLNYAFASSEYPAFVGSTFVDAFGIFVNGTNVALVPGTTTPVSINSVNASVNAGFFTQYSNPNTPFNYGGLTTLLTARANVSTTSINTIRFGIADSSDPNLDSAVLIQGGSFASSVPEPAGALLLATGLVLLGAFAALRRLPRFKTLAFSGLLLAVTAGTVPRADAQTGTSGAVFAMTNRAGNNEVIAFSRAADGTLTQAGRYSTRGNGIGVDFDAQGGLMLSVDRRYLYACSPGSDTITVFAVNGTVLTFLQKIYAGDQPLSLTIFGNLLYVMDGSVAGNQITGFTIAANGTLTPLPNSTKALSSPIAVPGEVRFSPDGKVLIVTHKVGSNIDVFRVGADGTPSDPVQNPSFGPRPFAAAFRNDGRLFVIESGLPTFNNAGVSSYNVNASTGALSVIAGSVKNGQTDGCWIVITNDQQYAFTANFLTNTISSYNLRPDGSAVLINGVAASPGDQSQPTDLGFSADSRYLYNLLRGTGGIAAYRVEANGTLTPLGIFGVGGGLPVADGASGLAAY